MEKEKNVKRNHRKTADSNCYFTNFVFELNITQDTISDSSQNSKTIISPLHQKRDFVLSEQYQPTYSKGRFSTWKLFFLSQQTKMHV